MYSKEYLLKFAKPMLGLLLILTCSWVSAGSLTVDLYRSGNSSNCDNNVSLKGINTDSISQIFLDNKMVWDSSNIIDEDKIIIFEKENLSIIVESCSTESMHLIEAIFENGTMVSQFVENYSNDSDVNERIPKAGIYWASRRGLMWIARNISSPTAINWIRTYGGNAAANAALRHSRYISRLMAYLARYERISLNGVYDRVRGGLIGSGVSSRAASGIAWAIKQGLKVLI